MILELHLELQGLLNSNFCMKEKSGGMSKLIIFSHDRYNDVIFHMQHVCTFRFVSVVEVEGCPLSLLIIMIAIMAADRRSRDQGASLIEYVCP